MSQALKGQAKTKDKKAEVNMLTLTNYTIPEDYVMYVGVNDETGKTYGVFSIENNSFIISGNFLGIDTKTNLVVIGIADEHKYKVKTTEGKEVTEKEISGVDLNEWIKTISDIEEREAETAMSAASRLLRKI